MNAITEIKIKLDSGKEVSLNPSEARQLFAELRMLFEIAGETPRAVAVPENVYPYSHQPIFIERLPGPCPYHPTPWEITWGGPEYAPSCCAAPTLLAIGRPSLPEWTS